MIPLRRRLPQSWLLLPTVWLFFFLALSSMVRDSPTMDEQNHIARGLAFIRTGDPRLSLEHPPLINSLSALPLLLLDVRLPTDDPSWQRPFGWYEFADLLLWHYNHDATRMVFLARLPIIFLTLGLALLGYHFAQQLWGGWAAPLAFGLLLFEPNILAHGRYATTDLGGTFFSLLATFCLWRLWQTEGWPWPRWLLAALAMGLAFGGKLSLLGFVPIWAVLSLLPLYDTPWSWRVAGRRLGQLLTAGLFSIPVVWLIFGLEWRPFIFSSQALQFLNSTSGPMPTFWAGIEQIGLLVNEGRFAAFLLGQFSDEGFWLYFPVAFLAKTALPVLLLLPVATLLLLRMRATRRRAAFLLVTAVLFFLLSMPSALNIGYRHLLPLLPYLLLLIAGLAEAAGRAARLGAGAGMVGLLLTTLAIHPFYLSYFTPFWGGPANGHNVLIDSNIDWGQDLLRLKQWMANHRVESVKLAWFGTADPDFYGIHYEPLPGLGRSQFYAQWSHPPFNTEQPESGIYALSVGSYWEIPLPPEQKYVFAWFRGQPPSDRVGYSILIYIIP